MTIEVELRSFIEEAQYGQLLEHFKKHATFVEEDLQETFYFITGGENPQDLRLQKNKKGGKIWLKKGQLHDEAREEIEVHFTDQYCPEAFNLLTALGYKPHIQWIRHRTVFRDGDLTICLDHTKGYGYIIELEILCEDGHQKEALEKLHQEFQRLGIPVTPKEVFAEKYAHYQKNWPQLLETT